MKKLTAKSIWYSHQPFAACSNKRNYLPAASTGKAQVNSLTTPTVSSDSKKMEYLYVGKTLLLNVLGNLTKKKKKKKSTEKQKRFFYIKYILEFHYTEKFLCLFASKN